MKFDVSDLAIAGGTLILAVGLFELSPWALLAAVGLGAIFVGVRRG